MERLASPPVRMNPSRSEAARSETRQAASLQKCVYGVLRPSNAACTRLCFRL